MIWLIRRKNSLRRVTCHWTLLSCLAAAVCLAPRTVPAWAEQQTQRVVQGKVVDKAGAGMKGATVYLKDSHTLSVRSYIAADDGAYRFGQLVQNTDYEVWAESDGRKSGVKNISSFDSRNEFNITLKIDK
jgi:Carboxypeptidase regulatory-like domain